MRHISVGDLNTFNPGANSEPYIALSPIQCRAWPPSSSIRVKIRYIAKASRKLLPLRHVIPRKLKIIMVQNLNLSDLCVSFPRVSAHSAIIDSDAALRRHTDNISLSSVIETNGRVETVENFWSIFEFYTAVDDAADAFTEVEGLAFSCADSAVLQYVSSWIASAL